MPPIPRLDYWQIASLGMAALYPLTYLRTDFKEHPFSTTFNAGLCGFFYYLGADILINLNPYSKFILPLAIDYSGYHYLTDDKLVEKYEQEQKNNGIKIEMK